MKRFLTIAIMAAATIAAMADEPAYKTYRPNTFYYQRASLFEAMPTDTTDIIMLGNSITNGGEWHELFGSTRFKNRGISSDGINGVRGRIDPILAGRPSKIFLMIGVNDIARDMPADSVAEKIIALADYVREKSPRTRLYVQSILPYNGAYGRFQGLLGKEHRIADVNRMLKQGARKHGYTYVDLHSAFVDPNGNLDPRYTNDGLHLTGAGYLHWAELLRPYID